MSIESFTNVTGAPWERAASGEHTGCDFSCLYNILNDAKQNRDAVREGWDVDVPCLWPLGVSLSSLPAPKS